MLLAFGAVSWTSALPLIAVSTFAGLCWASFLLALTANVSDDSGFLSLIGRIIVMPMFLFSGTFYPLSSLPLAVQWIGWISPLWHATQLGRWLSYGEPLEPWQAAISVAYLSALLFLPTFFVQERGLSLQTAGLISGVFPVNAFGVTVHLTPFASAAAEASGLKAAMRLQGIDATVVVWGGDGSTADIGFAGVSAAAERNEDIVYVLNDNEAYMNTGVQKSGATPEGAWTTTTPATHPRSGQKKEISRIMAAHGIPYTATLAAGSVPMVRDFRGKVTREIGRAHV